MDLNKVTDLHRKVMALAEHPGFTEIQRAFIEQLVEELARIALAQQLDKEVKAEATNTLEFVRQYCEEIRFSLEPARDTV